MRYKGHSQNDDTFATEGDRGFVGLVSRIDPANLATGYLSLAENVRLDRGYAQTRPAISWDATSFNITSQQLRLPFTLPANLGTDTGILYAGVVRSGLQTKIAYLTTTSLIFGTHEFTFSPAVSAANEPYFVQIGEKIYIFTGTETGVVLSVPSSNLHAGGTHTFTTEPNVPDGRHAIHFMSRLVVVTGDDEVKFSDIIQPTTFQAANVMRVGFGDGDPIVALCPFSDNQLLVFKRRSIHVITDVANLANAATIELTRQHGLLARKGISQIGDQVFYMSDRGIYSLTTGINAKQGTSTPVTLLKVLDTPLSEPVDDIFEKVTNGHVASMAYHQNRLYTALPYGAGQERNNRILVYNLLNSAFESFDSLSENLRNFDQLLEVEGKLYIVDRSGEVYIYDDDNRENDIIKTATTGDEVAVLDIEAKIRTRSYALGNTSLKKWHTGQIDWEGQRTIIDSFGSVTNNTTTLQNLYPAPYDQFLNPVMADNFVFNMQNAESTSVAGIYFEYQTAPPFIQNQEFVVRNSQWSELNGTWKYVIRDTPEASMPEKAAVFDINDLTKIHFVIPTVSTVNPNYALPTTPNNGHATNHTFATADRPLVVALDTQTINGVTLNEGDKFKLKKLNTSNNHGDLVQLDGTNIGWAGQRASKWEIVEESNGPDLSLEAGYPHFTANSYSAYGNFAPTNWVAEFDAKYVVMQIPAAGVEFYEGQRLYLENWSLPSEGETWLDMNQEWRVITGLLSERPINLGATVASRWYPDTVRVSLINGGADWSLMFMGADLANTMQRGTIVTGSAPNITYRVITSNPDSNRVYKSTTLQQSNDITSRVSLGGIRGQLVQLEIETAGNIITRRIEVEGSHAPQLTTDYK